MQRVNPIIHQVQQRTDEWHKLRLGKVTGSRAKDTILEVSNATRLAAVRELMDISAVTKAIRATQEFIELWAQDPFELCSLAGIEVTETEKRKNYRENMVGERLTGVPADPEPYVSYDMKWGMINEDLARTVYQMQERCLVEDGPFMEHPELKAGVSPDGVVTDTRTGELGLLEIKCLRSANHLFKIIETKEVPEEFIDQIQMQMWIGNYDWCDFVGYDSRLPDGLKLFVKRVAYDEEYVSNTLAPNVTRFLKEVGKKERYFRKLIREGKNNEKYMGHSAADVVDAKPAINTPQIPAGASGA